MAYIGKKPEDAFRGLAYYDTFTGDGSTTTFDLSADAPDGGQNDITVVVDNVRQEPGASKSYTLGVDGSGRYRRITFNTAPDNGSEIYAINPGRSTQLNTVSDNAITAAKLQTDAVTTAKIQDSAVTNDKLAGSIANAKLANSSITINGTAVSLGGSVTAGTDWQAVTVADGSTTLNAVAGKGYFLDTNAGVIEVFLPTSPSRGDTVILADYSGTFGTNKCIVNTGGALIDSTEGGPGSSSDFKLTTNNQVVELVYVDAAKGWLVQTNSAPSGLSALTGGGEYGASFITATGGTVTESGDYKIHTFTGDGCFVVSNVGNPAGSNTVDYLVVAGGGSGGLGNSLGGGAGAGGYRESSGTASGCYSVSPLGACVAALPVSATTYPVTVGGGGAGGSNPTSIPGNNGSNSVFSTITSTGGGGGSGFGSPTLNGNPGGSGGGGAGNTPPTSPPQGNNGGAGGGAGFGCGAAGGGGAGAVGSTASPGVPVNGGDGVTTSISGSPTAYAGGGGGGSNGLTNNGGLGGGGAGGDYPGGNATAGSANTGGGGGGNGECSSSTSAGSGGKGIVIIRYKFQ
jgi:hypothetical protein